MPTIKMAWMRRDTAKRDLRACMLLMRRLNTVAAMLRAVAAEDQRVPRLFCRLAASFSKLSQFYKWYHSFCKMKGSFYKMSNMVSFIL